MVLVRSIEGGCSGWTLTISHKPDPVLRTPTTRVLPRRDLAVPGSPCAGPVLRAVNVGEIFSTASGARAVGQKRLLPMSAGEILAPYLGVRIQAWSAAAEPSHRSARRLAVPNSQIVRKA